MAEGDFSLHNKVRFTRTHKKWLVGGLLWYPRDDGATYPAERMQRKRISDTFKQELKKEWRVIRLDEYFILKKRKIYYYRKYLFLFIEYEGWEFSFF